MNITAPSLQTASNPALATKGLLKDLRHMINQTRQSIASKVNTGLTVLYWNIGSRIRTETLKDKRAEYGKEIVATVSRQLTKEYGKGFLEKNLWLMIQFSESFSDEKILLSLVNQLCWSHFRLLLPIKDVIKKVFYVELCRVERWNVRTLRKKIDSMLFERMALSKRPDLVASAELDVLSKENQLTPDLVFRDPDVLEFLNLNDRYMEKDLEDAIMRELE